MNILHNIDHALFLRDYWQKKPLLIRAAFPEFQNPQHHQMGPDELMTFARAETMPSKLIIENPKARTQSEAWRVQHGPFSAKDFTKLPKSHWSLLVCDLEKHSQRCRDFLDAFRFIPDWRIDDLMISYAPYGSSVGPHVDEYDVFLLQAAGKKHWKIDCHPQDLSLIEDLDIKILQRFTPDAEWLLEPGDVLYLPPGIPHHGIAASHAPEHPSMTWSIGFRAPSQHELLTAFADYLYEYLPDTRYQDNGLIKPVHPAEIRRAELERIAQMIRTAVQTDSDKFDQWFGRFITEPQHDFWIAEPEHAWTTQSAAHCIKQNETLQLQLHTAVRSVYILNPEAPSRCTLFINGDVYPCATQFAQKLCGQRGLRSADLQAFLQDTSICELIAMLYNTGYLLQVTENQHAT